MKKILYPWLGILFWSSAALSAGFDFKSRQQGFLTGPVSTSIFTQVQFGDQFADCLVDTGARFTVAKEKYLLTSPKVGEVTGGGISGKERVADLVQSDVHVGDWYIQGAVIGRKDQIPAECLLGNDFFLEREFSIDFFKEEFADEDSFPGATFPLNIYRAERGGHFGMKVEVAHESIEVLFDTGATDTAIDIEFVQAHPEFFKFVKEVDVQEGSNQTIKAGVYKLKRMKMGPLVFEDVRVYVLSLKYLQSKIPGIKAVMGLNQIRNHKWYINNKKSVWGVYP